MKPKFFYAVGLVAAILMLIGLDVAFPGNPQPAFVPWVQIANWASMPGTTNVVTITGALSASVTNTVAVSQAAIGVTNYLAPLAVVGTNAISGEVAIKPGTTALDVNMTNAPTVGVTNGPTALQVAVTNALSVTANVTNNVAVINGGTRLDCAVTNPVVITHESIGITNLAGSTLSISVTNTLTELGVTNGTVALDVNVTNATIAVTQAAVGVTNLSGSTLSSAVTNTVNVVGTNSVGGFTLVTNITFYPPEGDAAVAVGDAQSGEIEIVNAVRVAGGTGIFQNITYINNTNTTPTLNFILCSAPITWPATSAAVNLVFTEISTNLIDMFSSDKGTWKVVGTNAILTVPNLGIPIKCMTNSLFLYMQNTAVVTNSLLGAAIVPKIYKD